MMLSGFRRAYLPLAAAALFVPTSLATRSAQAGPFEDLLFGRRNAYYYPVGDRYVPAAPVAVAPAVTYAQSPVTAYMPSAPTTAYQPATCNQPVTTGYAPAQTVAPATASTCAPAVSNTTYYAPAAVAPTTVYAPTTPGCGCGAPRTVNMYPAVPDYRTVWYRVPTTNFRPVTAYDPATCGQVTTLQPCTTYTWQARRVPERRGFFSWLFHRRGTPRTTPIYPYSACATQPVISGGVPTVITTPGTTVQGSQAPADIPPTLDPGVYVPPAGASLNGTTTVPTEVPTFNSDPIDTARPIVDPPTTVELSTEASANHRPHSAPNSVAPNTLNENSEVTSNTQSAVRRNEPKPVPDPDAMIQTQKRFAPPKLINPRDRRASSGPAPGSFVLISWPKETTAKKPVVKPEATQQSTQPQAPATRPSPVRDDSGWRSVPR